MYIYIYKYIYICNYTFVRVTMPHTPTGFKYSFRIIQVKYSLPVFLKCEHTKEAGGWDFQKCSQLGKMCGSGYRVPL